MIGEQGKCRGRACETEQANPIPCIEIINLTKSFGNKQVLNNFNAVFYPGVNCLLGNSGIGKTTLANLILGLIKSDSGEIKGTEDKTINCVFQENRLMESLSAIKNLMLVCRKTQKNEALALLQQMGLEGNAHCPVSALSGGMRRRVAIARALIKPANIYIFDEPFNGLDDVRKDSIIGIIKERTEGAILILITHDALEIKALGCRKVSMV